MIRNIGHGEIFMHERDDGSNQLRDNLSRLWCVCGKPAIKIEPEMVDTVYEFQCKECNEEYHA